jgi:uracil-DNA glycosylase
MAGSERQSRLIIAGRLLADGLNFVDGLQRKSVLISLALMCRAVQE